MHIRSFYPLKKQTHWRSNTVSQSKYPILCHSLITYELYLQNWSKGLMSCPWTAVALVWHRWETTDLDPELGSLGTKGRISCSLNSVSCSLSLLCDHVCGETWEASKVHCVCEWLLMQCKTCKGHTQQTDVVNDGYSIHTFIHMFFRIFFILLRAKVDLELFQVTLDIWP